MVNCATFMLGLLATVSTLSTVVLANEERFADFQKAFDLVAKEPEAHRSPFADEAVFEFCFRSEADAPVSCMSGNYEETNVMFVDAIKTYKGDFKYVHGSQDKTIFTYAAYLETKEGCKSFYTGSGWLEYNDEGLITRQLSFSDDSGTTMKCVLAFGSNSGKAEL